MQHTVRHSLLFSPHDTIDEAGRECELGQQEQ